LAPQSWQRVAVFMLSTPQRQQRFVFNGSRTGMGIDGIEQHVLNCTSLTGPSSQPSSSLCTHHVRVVHFWPHFEQ
jgi:hypothetical protein